MTFVSDYSFFEKLVVGARFGLQSGLITVVLILVTLYFLKEINIDHPPYLHVAFVTLIDRNTP